jgi:uncharacterized protein involved in exopolysaccharide biosynthesis
MPYGALTVLCKQWQCFMTVLLLIILGGGGYLIFSQPLYESVARLALTFGDGGAPDLGHSPVTQLSVQDRREIIFAHAAILQSHDLAQATIESFGIGTVYPKIAARRPAHGTPMDAAVLDFLDNLTIDVGAQDNIITVAIRHPDKELAPRLVQKLIDLYVARQTDIFRNPHQEFLEQEVRKVGARLADTETDLEQFKGQWHITDYDAEVKGLLTQRGDLDIALNKARANLAQSQQRQQELQLLLRKVPEKLPDSPSGEKYRALDDARSRLAELRTKQSQMLATYSPNSPAMASLNAGIATAEAEVQARSVEVGNRATTLPNNVYQNLQTDYLRASADAESDIEPVKILTEQMAAINQRLTELQRNSGPFNDLQREHKIAEETYRTLSLAYADARIKGNRNDQRISPAVVISDPTQPYMPARGAGRKITLLVCLLAGAVLGAAAALLREAFDQRFTTAEQVAHLLDLPVLASLERRPHPIHLELLALGGTE